MGAELSRVLRARTPRLGLRGPSSPRAPAPPGVTAQGAPRKPQARPARARERSREARPGRAYRGAGRRSRAHSAFRCSSGSPRSSGSRPQAQARRRPVAGLHGPQACLRERKTHRPPVLPAPAAPAPTPGPGPLGPLAPARPPAWARGAVGHRGQDSGTLGCLRAPAVLGP